jgi:hypothetical protein
MLVIDLANVRNKKSLFELMSRCQARGFCYTISEVDLRAIPKERL